MTYKMLLFDLDGTLLSEERSIAPSNLNILQRLMNAGVKVGLATGRSHRSVKPYVELLKPNGPLILFNGARVWSLEENRFIYENGLTHNQALRALKMVRSFEDVHVNLYVDDQVLISHKTWRSRESEHKDGVPHTVVGDLADWTELHRAKPIKIMLISEPKTLNRFKAQFLNGLQETCSLIHSEWNYLEIMQNGVNKGQTLKKIESFYGISSSEIVSFGDNLNDMDLIRFSGLGIAMGNAHEDLKREADRTIGHHQTSAIHDCLVEVFGSLL